MTENEALALMKGPSDLRPSKPYRGGVIQILVTSSCNLSCYNCTQASQIRRKPWFMTPQQYAQALESLRGYWGVVGMFGGNPAIHPEFERLCQILRDSWVPLEQRGIWCNNPLTAEKASHMRRTFNPRYSNLNVHLDATAHKLFKDYWPESQVVGMTTDSRHSPVFVAMKDVVVKDCWDCQGYGNHLGHGPDRGNPQCETCKGTGKIPDESRIWELASNCDINQRWSAMIGVFRGELRAWFCEVAGAQAILHQWDTDQVNPMPACTCGADRTGPSAEAHREDCPAGVRFTYQDTGLDPIAQYEVETRPGERLERTLCSWWQLPMLAYRDQVRKHCFDCGVPLRGYGSLSQEPESTGRDQVSKTHAAQMMYYKRKERTTEIVTQLQQLGIGRLSRTTDYLQNSKK